jgi:putative phosphoesterase
MIGIMADSHDNLHSIKHAVRIFKEAECKLVIHAGDFVAPFAAKELENLGCPVKAVFGNCDGEKQGLEKVLRAFGEIKKAPLAFSHQGLRFLVMHIPARLDLHVSSGKFDVIIFAHSHKPELKKKKRTLLINPGETGGWLSGKSTAALLDPATLSAEIIALD